MTGRLLAIAAVCAILFVALGLWVTHHPVARLDAQSVVLRGSNVPLAIVLTNSGYGVALTCIALASIAVGVALRAPLKIPLAIIVSQILSQGVVNVIKGAFARARPDGWLYRHEAGFSYPSGHATTAIVFYGAWLAVVWAAPLPLGLRIAGVAILGAWLLGIAWSRIALGAHYPTDVIGGVLLGTAWLCLTIASGALRDAGLTSRHT